MYKKKTTTKHKILPSNKNSLTHTHDHACLHTIVSHNSLITLNKIYVNFKVISGLSCYIRVM